MPETTPQSLKRISKTIRYVAIAEGISYLLLLSLSILKRTTDLEVQRIFRFMGMTHGVLFILFVATIGLGIYSLKWSWAKATWAFVASLIPFGTFYLDYKLKKEEDLME